jgi:hypothetical protein
MVMFAFDGLGISQSGNQLSGGPRYFMSAGSHGNLNSSVGTGGQIQIPEAVDRWVTTLQPIPLAISSGGFSFSFDIPGVIGVIYVLMDQHATPDSDMEAWHAAFNNMVSSQFNELIGGIQLDAVAVEINDAMTHQHLDQADAVTQVFTNLFQPVINVLTSYSQAEIFYSVFQASGLGGEILSAVDPDQFQGSSFHYWTQTLPETTSDATTSEPAVSFTPGATTGPSPFVFYDNLFGSGPSGYYVNGAAWQSAIITVTPIPEGVAPGRWQVTGVNLGWSEDQHRSFISQIGGVFPTNRNGG